MTNNNDKKVLNVPHSADKGNTIRNVPLLRFPEFTKEWIYKTIDEIFELRNGYTPSKANQSFWNNGTIPWFRMEDIRLNGGVLYDAIQHITPEAVKGSGLFEPYSIILATTATIGEHAMIIADSLANQRFTNFKVRKSLSHRYDPYYLYYYFFRIDEWCLKNTNAGGLLSVDIPSLKRKAIYAPLLDEQTKIVKLLRLIDERIATQNKIIEDLKKLKSAISKHLFTRKDLLETTICLSEIATLRNGYAFQSSKYNALGKWKILTITNVSGERHINDDDCNCIINLPDDIQDHQVLKEGDILISLTGNVGRVSLCKDGDYLLNQRVGLLQLAKNVNQEFLYQILSSQKFEKSMIACGQGAAQMNIGKGDVESYVLPYSLNDNNILWIAKLLHSYDECIINEQRRLTLLTMQKQYLLSQMFI